MARFFIADCVSTGLVIEVFSSFLRPLLGKVPLSFFSTLLKMQRIDHNPWQASFVKEIHENSHVDQAGRTLSLRFYFKHLASNN